MQIFGIILCALVLLYLLPLLVSSYRRHAQEKGRRRQTLEGLLQRVEAARSAGKGRASVPLAWNGDRHFVVERKVDEGGGICSFYLVPLDKKSLPSFLPGQYLTFQVNLPGQPRPLVRCYSLSDAPNPTYYRVTIKKVPLMPDSSGKLPVSVSNHFHDRVQQGDVLNVKAPRGKFFLDVTRQTPVVLIGGGVGITPFLSMVNALTALGSQREVWLFYGVRHGQEQIMKEHFRLVTEKYANCRVRLCYSKPNPEDVCGRDFHVASHVSAALLKSALPSNAYEFYICGPPAMMNDLGRDLKEWGVPEERILSEAFGPATVKKAFPPPTETATAAGPALVQISFSQTGKQCVWQPEAGNLLDFALANGIPIASGCRAGNCGTCEVPLKTGSVSYVHEPGWEIQSGHCLTCIAVPKGAVVLDA